MATKLLVGSKGMFYMILYIFFLYLTTVTAYLDFSLIFPRSSMKYLLDRGITLSG